MKHFLSLLLLLAFACNLKAQQPQYNSDEILNFQKNDQLNNNDFGNTLHRSLNKAQLKELAWKYNTFIAYDTLGNLKEYITSTFDEINSILVIINKKWQQNIWIYDYITTRSYDSNGNLLSSIYKEYKNNIWEQSLCNFTYDNNQNLLSEEHEYFNNNIWIKQDSISYTYNINNKNLNTTWWYRSDNQWKRHFNDYYIYDSIGNLIEKYRKVLLSSPVFDSRNIYTYDTTSKLKTELQEFYNYNKWEKSQFIEYTYNFNGQIFSKSKKFFYDNICKMWEYHSYIYDSKNNIIADTSKGWVLNFDTTKYLTTYTFDSNNNLLSELIWHLDDNLWISSFKTSYTYDSLGNALTGINQKYLNGSWVPTENTLWIITNGKICEDFQRSYRYEISQTPISQQSKYINTYPNPSKGQFFVEINEFITKPYDLKIINSLNQIVYQLDDAADNKLLVNLPNLATGMYFIHLTINGKAYLEKIIINKNL